MAILTPACQSSCSRGHMAFRLKIFTLWPPPMPAPGHRHTGNKTTDSPQYYQWPRVLFGLPIKWGLCPRPVNRGVARWTAPADGTLANAVSVEA